MIRYLFLLLSFVLLSSTKCSNSNKSSSNDSIITPVKKPQTVYITTNGKKYHTGNCRSVKKSKIDISLPDAINKGYEPCKLCHPPIADSIAP